ncbi:MAG: AAA family ATPase [Limisphaerales bacterium]
MAKSTCLSCGQHIEHPDELVGEQIVCPNCGAKTRLNSPSPSAIRIPKFKDPSVREPGGSPVAPVASRIIDNIEKVIVGKRAEIVFTLAAYFAEGHVLLEDVPGVAKTMLARALASSIGCSFKRIQCTPDLLPGDITGSSVFNPKTTNFEFRPGPLFAQIVLADEINRATPRAQSALLEAMAERKVTADGINYDLAPPFLLIATQNPIDHEGTFPLPEAQLDRFLVRLRLGYPQKEEEISMLHRLQAQHPINTLATVATAQEVVACQKAVCKVYVDEKVSRYIVEIIQATREHPDLSLGGSPRASMALLRFAQSFAAMNSYEFVVPDDVKQAARHVLGHRLILRPESRLRKKTVSGVLDEILKTVPVPQMPATPPAR